MHVLVLIMVCNFSFFYLIYLGQLWPNPLKLTMDKQTCESLKGWCRHRNCNLDIGDPICNGKNYKIFNFNYLLERCNMDVPFGGGMCTMPFNELSRSPINHPNLCEVYYNEFHLLKIDNIT